MNISRKKSIYEDFNSSEIEFELDSFIDYLELTNNLIDEKLIKYMKDYKDAGEYADVIYDGLDAYIKSKSLQLYYSSIIISLYSLLEQSMFKLCKAAEKNFSLKIYDIAGKGIFQYKIYLEKVVNIDFSGMNNEWNEITKYNHLRNLFVHTSNTIIHKTESKNRINAIREIKDLKITELANKYVIDFDNDKPVRHFVMVIGRFMRKILTIKA